MVGGCEENDITAVASNFGDEARDGVCDDAGGGARGVARGRSAVNWGDAVVVVNAVAVILATNAAAVAVAVGAMFSMVGAGGD
jgi:hypothetical protein